MFLDDFEGRWFVFPVLIGPSSIVHVVEISIQESLRIIGNLESLCCRPVLAFFAASRGRLRACTAAFVGANCAPRVVTVRVIGIVAILV